MPAIELDAVPIGDHAHFGRQPVLAPVQRKHRFASLCPTHRQVARHLGGVEDVQRPAAVEGDVVGDVHQRVDRPQPDRQQALLQPFRRRAVLHPAHHPKCEAAAERLAFGEVQGNLHRARADAWHGRHAALLQAADPGSGEIARDAMDTGGIGAIGRQADLEDRIVESGIGGEAGSHRRVLRQLDDAVMLVRDLQLALRQHHAAALHAADLPHRKRRVDAGDIGAGRGKGADQPGSRIGRPAHHLHRRLPLAGIDRQHLQLVGVGMLLGRQHPRDDEGLQARFVVDRLHFKADRGQPLGNLAERRFGFQVVLQPGEGEFHAKPT